MTIDGMGHERAREALEALALDALDGAERAAVLVHVARCAACQGALAELQAAAAALSYAVSPVPMDASSSAHVRARLLARASADRAAPRDARATPPAPAPAVVAEPVFHPSPAYHIMVPRASPAAEAAIHPKWEWRDTVAVWTAVAATFIALISVGVAYQMLRQRNALATAYQVAATERMTGTAAADSLRARLVERDRLIGNLTGPQVAVVTLASNTVRTASARMFWDQSVDAWTFVGHNFPQPRAGRTYQLWLVTANSRISAGTFAPTADGNAIVRATYPLKPDALSAVAVTDEPAAGSEQPTTTPFLVGARSTR